MRGKRFWVWIAAMLLAPGLAAQQKQSKPAGKAAEAPAKSAPKKPRPRVVLKFTVKEKKG